MRIIYIAAVLFLLIASACCAQENEKREAAKKDTAQNLLKLYNDALRINRGHQKFFNGIFPLLNNNNFYHELYLGQQQPGVKLQNAKAVPDPLADFKKNLYKLLALQYGAAPNYDLGEIGRYLLYLKNMTVFYLAILSIL